eukprot:1142302-Pelagomonas_calceolata.AAC.7
MYFSESIIRIKATQSLQKASTLGTSKCRRFKKHFQSSPWHHNHLKGVRCLLDQQPRIIHYKEVLLGYNGQAMMHSQQARLLKTSLPFLRGALAKSSSPVALFWPLII